MVRLPPSSCAVARRLTTVHRFRSLLQLLRQHHVDHRERQDSRRRHVLQHALYVLGPSSHAPAVMLTRANLDFRTGQGNASAVCGSGYISNVYAKKDALLPIGALPSASATTSTVAAQSSAAASSFVSELNSSASSSASVSSVVKSASSAISAYSSASSAAYTSALSSMVSSMSSASQASATSASLATSPTAQAVAGRPAASPASDSVASRCITPEQSSRREAALSTQAAPTSSTAALVGREVVEEEEDDLTAPVISQDALAHALAEHRRRSLKRWLVHGHQD
jgi:hypothetical protein